MIAIFGGCGCITIAKTEKTNRERRLKIKISRSENNRGLVRLALYANEKPVPHSFHTIYAI